MAMDCITWGVAARALSGAAESGDQCLVKPFADGVLLTVVDGLGHGPEAAAAARTAIATLGERPQEPVISLVKRCHEALKPTRGAVMTIASFNVRESAMTWLGVGNVEALLIRADMRTRLEREAALLRAGVVGYQLPPLRAQTIPIGPGDLLIMVTDGIGGGFTQGLVFGGSPQQMADHILAHFAKETDDALALVARLR